MLRRGNPLSHQVKTILWCDRAMPESSVSHLKTLDRALQVLSLFSVEQPEWDYTCMAETLGLHKSIVYRILTTFERYGYVMRQPASGRFRLGFRFVELGNLVLSNIDLRTIAHPFMEDLVRAVRETAFLTVVSGHESVCIDRAESPHLLRLTMEIGGRYPLYAGASNRLLMAYLPEEEIEAIIAKGLKAYTPNTLVDPDALRASLAEIRRQGYALSSSELTPGMSALSVPLRNSNHEVVAALSLAGPSERFGDDRWPEMLTRLQATAEAISQRLLAWRVPQSGRAGL